MIQRHHRSLQPITNCTVGDLLRAESLLSGGEDFAAVDSIGQALHRGTQLQPFQRIHVHQAGEDIKYLNPKLMNQGPQQKFAHRFHALINQGLG